MNIKGFVQALEASDSGYSGAVFTDRLHQMMYATDASIYRELPAAVVIPENVSDVQQIVRQASRYGVPVIPRGAGTSLAGQVVGNGVIIDFTAGFNKIVELNPDDAWVIVQPGVNRDDLNDFLEPHGLFFSPNTSTSNRCLIGGMIGNNSCGTTSIRYGTTRDHVLELECVLSDGSLVTFNAIDRPALEMKMGDKSLEGDIYRQYKALMYSAPTRAAVLSAFPSRRVTRRNTGYAVDVLFEQFDQAGPESVNFAPFVCGSEGTLCLVTSAKLHLDPLPPKNMALIAAHFRTIRASLEATRIAVQHRIYGCELMDDIIIDCARSNAMYASYGDFIRDNPKAVLMIECRSDDPVQLDTAVQRIINQLKAADLGYAYPVLQGEVAENAWKLRKGGLGLLANIDGDPVAVACIEDTAVSVDDLPDYIDDFTDIMKRHGQRAVYYAHAGAGELHLRPILNLKTTEGLNELRSISQETAELVKKYNGSLSGEHGDGRVRSEFIESFYGPEVNEVFSRIKDVWDPQGIMNPGKIVDPVPMDIDLRYKNSTNEPVRTIFDFGSQGMLGMAEKCNGSGDCRKSHLQGGTMCPSYMASRKEKDTTRARANVLREIMTAENGIDFNDSALEEAMDMCLSCKGCTSECPSNVDVAALKSEYLHQRSKLRRRSLSDRVFGQFDRYAGLLHSMGAIGPILANTKALQAVARRLLNVPASRSMPRFNRSTFLKWWAQHAREFRLDRPDQTVVLYVDEFTNFLDMHIGLCCVEVLHGFNVQVKIYRNPFSARAQLSKGFLQEARELADANIRFYREKISAGQPLIGIEPSAILGFRDEFPRICSPELRADAEYLKSCVLTAEEYLFDLVKNGDCGQKFSAVPFTKILVHGHCHQKALSDISKTAFLLSAIPGVAVEVLPSGCCGMAGSFGMDKGHFAMSQEIGNLVLFPAILENAQDTVISASGTSCRHQILDGTGRRSYHPVELLRRSIFAPRP